MLQDTITIETRYKLFIESAAVAKLVWGLKNKGGWANTTSQEDEEVDVIPFWSDKALAKACARDEWKGYLPVAIPLAEFLESWCIELAENNTLVGADWDANMLGKEGEALAVALDVLKQLNIIGSTIVFLNYGSVGEFISEIKEVEN